MTLNRTPQEFTLGLLEVEFMRRRGLRHKVESQIAKQGGSTLVDIDYGTWMTLDSELEMRKRHEGDVAKCIAWVKSMGG